MDEIKRQLFFQSIGRVQALARCGLSYTKDIYDKERFLELQSIAAEMLACLTDESFDYIHGIFSQEKGYATPKVDVRGVILQDQRILLVRERQDGLWSLPGGWADIGQSPSECIVREVFEEAGFQTRVERLLALWDNQKHEHPMQWPQVYKCFFHCQIESGTAKPNHEITAVDFFPVDNLPKLSLSRVTPKQIFHLLEILNCHADAQFD